MVLIPRIELESDRYQRPVITIILYQHLYNISISKLFTQIIHNLLHQPLTLPAVKPPTKYLSKIKNSKSTGTVIITDPAIKYCLGTS